MTAGFRGDARPRPAVHAHRIELLLRSAGLAGGEVELRAVVGELHIGHLELAGGELLGVAAQRGDFVEMVPAIALAFEVDFVAILEPAERFIARPIQPRIVMLVEQRGGFRGRGVERLNPAILIVDRAHDHHGARALFVEQRQIDIHLLVAQAGIGPLNCARHRIQNCYARALLRIADVGPSLDLLGVARFGDVVRNVVRLVALGAIFDQRDDAFLAGAQFQVSGRSGARRARTACADSRASSWLPRRLSAGRGRARRRSAPFPAFAGTPGCCPAAGLLSGLAGAGLMSVI